MSDDANPDDPTPADDDGDATDLAGEVEAALAEVRREALKADALVALVDAILAGLAVNLGLTLAGVTTPPSPVGPATTGDLLAFAAAVAVGGASLFLRARRPAIERFEAANPPVREALRTARDAVDDGRTDPVAGALYADVLDRLRETSSRDLLAWWRVCGTLVLVVAVAFGTVGATGTGFGAAPAPAATAGNGTPGTAGDRTAGGVDGNGTDLRPGDEVLGDPTNVSAGDENVTAEVDPGLGGRGDRRSYDKQGYAGDEDGGVSARRAGYADAGTVEEADLIREYTLALDEGDGDADGGDRRTNESDRRSEPQS